MLANFKPLVAGVIFFTIACGNLHYKSTEEKHTIKLNVLFDSLLSSNNCICFCLFRLCWSLQLGFKFLLTRILLTLSTQYLWKAETCYLFTVSKQNRTRRVYLVKSSNRDLSGFNFIEVSRQIYFNPEQSFKNKRGSSTFQTLDDLLKSL